MDYRAREAAAFAGGNIGKAKEMCASDDFFAFKEEVLRMALSFKDTGRASENTWTAF